MIPVKTEKRKFTIKEIIPPPKNKMRKMNKKLY